MRGTHRPSLRAAVAVAALALVTASCAGTSSSSAGGSTTGPATAATSTTSPSTTSASPSRTQSATTAEVERETEDLDRTAFTRSAVVDNRWFPLTPGVRLVYDGSSTVDGEKLKHRVVFTVTDLVKEVDGVLSAVLYELDYTEGVLNEAELAFFAQADDGTVWHLGQYPEEYEDGKFAAAPTWIAGQAGAKAGIVMKADPQLGKPSYAQGWGPAVDWKDRARLIKTGQRTCVPAGCYSDVIVTQEFTRAEPDAFQLKFYAAGLGNVRVGWAGAKETEHEELQLTRVTKLDAAGLTSVRAAALALEKHAYQVSKDVYGTTDPMRRATS